MASTVSTTARSRGSYEPARLVAPQQKRAKEHPIRKRRLRGYPPFSVAAGATVAGCVLIATVLAGYTYGQRTTPVDLEVDQVARSHLAPLFPVLGVLVDQAPPGRVLAGCAVLAVLALVRGRPRTGALCLVGPGLALAVSGLGKEFLKRPSATLGGQFDAYPSGHMTAVVAAATVVLLLSLPGGLLSPGPGRLGRWSLRTAVGGFVVLFGTALTALRHHYVTDVVGAAAVAVGMVLLAALVLGQGRGIGIYGTSRPLTVYRDGTTSSNIDLDCEDPCL